MNHQGTIHFTWFEKHISLCGVPSLFPWTNTATDKTPMEIWHGFKTGSQKYCPWPEDSTHTDMDMRSTSSSKNLDTHSKMMFAPLWFQTQCLGKKLLTAGRRWAPGLPPGPWPRPDDCAIFIHPRLHVAHLVAKGILLLVEHQKHSKTTVLQRFKHPKVPVFLQDT